MQLCYWTRLLPPKVLCSSSTTDLPTAAEKSNLKGRKKSDGHVEWPEEERIPWQDTVPQIEIFSEQSYGIPKIHKPGYPLWPIVSAIGSPSYNIAKFITSIISPLMGNSSSYM